MQIQSYVFLNGKGLLKPTKASRKTTDCHWHRCPLCNCSHHCQRTKKITIRAIYLTIEVFFFSWLQVLNNGGEGITITALTQGIHRNGGGVQLLEKNSSSHSNHSKKSKTKFSRTSPTRNLFFSTHPRHAAHLFFPALRHAHAQKITNLYNKWLRFNEPKRRTR